MQPIYIIDGYNMLHTVPELRSLLDQNLESARNRLETWLQGYLGAKQVKIILVYDGQWQSVQFVSPVRGNFQILFSKSPQTADDLIKQLIGKPDKSRKLTVVTRDAEIVRFAKAHHAQVLEPLSFFSLVRFRAEDDSAQQQKYQSKMSDAELKEWLTIFGENSGESKKDRGN
jgi:predicted RNA-binding protein with PIN domain